MVTIKEIAREANVSPTTVSLILNNKSKERKISAQTEQRVLEIAKRMGYLPNLQAVSLKKATGQFSYRILIFWVADSRAQTMLRFFRGLEATIESESLPYEVLLQSYKAGSLQLAMRNELVLSCHGIIVCNATETDLEFLDSNCFPRPLILYNRYSKKYPSVVMDDRSIGTIPAEVFASHGKKKPAIITTQPIFNGMNIRQNLFAYTCLSRNMEEPLVYYCADSFPIDGYETTLRLLKEHPEADCILYMREDFALGALRAFAEKGIVFPGNIEFISIGDSGVKISESCYPSLSIVYLPLEKLAAECIRLMNHQLHSFDNEVTASVVPVTYISRESCPDKLYITQKKD